MEQTSEAIVQPAGGARLKKSSKKPLLIGGAVLVVLLAVYLGLCLWAGRISVFFPNSAIHGIDVGGLTAKDASLKVAQELPGRAVSIYLNTDGSPDFSPEGQDAAASIVLEELGVLSAYPTAEDLTLGAFLTQHGSGIPVGFFYLASLFGQNTARADALSCDSAKLDAMVQRLQKQLNQAPQDASYTLSDSAILWTAPRDGWRLPADTLKETLCSAVETPSQNPQRITLSPEILPAKTLSAKALYDEVSGEVKNAGYDAATGAIIPERAGAEFDVSAAQSLLDAAQPGETVTIPADIELPRVTAETLQKVLFRDVLGECRTHVGGSAGRISNVKLSSAAFDGVVLNSGDVFSYNETVGKRTEAKGYCPAPAYVKGETVDEIGGGVCQPSSTLYLACLRSNLEITERYAHRYVPSYIPWGMDATVSWNGPDYKFTNDTSYPIKITATYSGGYLTVKLLGTNESGVTAKIANETLSTTPWETVYEDNETLAPGTEEVKVTPYTGYKVRTYRNLYSADGKLLSSAFEASSNYKVRNKVILRGPAAPVTEPEVPAVGPGEIPAEPSAPLEPTPEVPTPEVPTPEPPAVVAPEPAEEAA